MTIARCGNCNCDYVFEDGHHCSNGPDRDPLLIEREKTHGSFTDVAECAQRLKLIFRQNAIRLTDLRQAEALDLISTKIARILCGSPKEKDHWNDIAGYAKLGAEACDE